MHRSNVVTFVNRETLVDLIIIDILDFDIIFGMDSLASYHAILECYTKAVTLAP